MATATLLDGRTASCEASAAGLPSLPVRLTLLGQFMLTSGDQEVAVPESAQRLLVLLALRGRPQTRLFLAGSLWPEKTDERAAANLRSSLWRARIPGGPSLVLAKGSLLCLAPEVSLDVEEMEAAGWGLLAQGVSPPPGRPVRSLFFEELLPGWYDDWVILERERIGQLQLHFLEGLVESLLASERYAEALDTALRLKAADPLRDRSQRVIVRVYEAEGSPHLAQRCRDEYLASVDA